MPDDCETPVAYWVDRQTLAASEIQHRKSNVDSSVKRGYTLLFPVRKNLTRAVKSLRNMSISTEIQTAIALIRRHQVATQAAVRTFVAGKTSTIDRRLAANLSHRQVESLDRIDGTLRDIEQTFRSLTAKLAGVITGDYSDRARRVAFPELVAVAIRDCKSKIGRRLRDQAEWGHRSAADAMMDAIPRAYLLSRIPTSFAASWSPPPAKPTSPPRCGCRTGCSVRHGPDSAT